MGLYDAIVQLIGTLPTEFEFIYAIVTTVVALMIVSTLSSLFYVILKIVRGVI